MSGSEINRLIELMPASGRMYCKVVSNSNQPTVVAARLPRPGQETRPIQINFHLWEKLPQPQRDLLLLRTVCWLISIQWFKLDLYHGLVIAAAGITLLELLQANAAGMLTFGGLTAVAITQIWRQNRSSQVEMIADEKALQVAQRRGYSLPEAAQALASAIAAVASLEERSLTFIELLRCQNLQTMTTSTGSVAVLP